MRKSRKLCFTLVILVGCAFLAELLLRVVPPFNRYVTFYARDARGRNAGANREFTFQGSVAGIISDIYVRVRTNSLGFHDREYAIPKRAGVYRVLVLGDSQVQGIEVHLEDTFQELLETKLRDDGVDVEVIALGRAGNSAGQAREFYRDLGRQYDPDLVIWSFYDTNDIADADRALSRRVWTRRKPSIPPKLLQRSKIATFLWTRKWRAKRHADDSGPPTGPYEGEFARYNTIRDPLDIVFTEPWPPAFEGAWKKFSEQLLGLIADVQADQRQMVIVSTAFNLPHPWQRTAWESVGLGCEPYKPDRLVEEIADGAAVRFVTLKPAYEEAAAAGKRVTHPHDGHLNELGHRLVAEALYRELKSVVPPATNE